MTGTSGQSPESSHPLQGWTAEIFSSAPLGSVLTSTDGTLLAVNRAFARFLGYGEDELVGRQVRDITDPLDAPESVAGVQALIAGTIQAFRQEKRYLRADGAVVWARTSVTALHDDEGRPIGVIAQIEEIGERLEAERRLARSEAMLRSVFESSPIPNATMDTQGRVLSANKAMLTLTAAAAAEELSWSRLLGAAQPDDVTGVWRLLAGAGGTLEFECQVRRAGQAPITVLAVATAADATDGSLQMIVQMVDITEQKAALADAVHRSLHDELTGLSNRLHLDERLNAALSDRRRDRRRLAVVMIDLDRFKEVNDGFGRVVGDEVLVEVARRIEGVCRHADTVGRVGGDEFCVLVNNIEDEFEAIKFSTAVLRALSAPFPAGGTNVHVGASIGFAISPDDGTDAAQLMRKADSAQYRAKQLRTGWAAFSTEIDDSRLDRLQLALDLKIAVADGLLHVAYQPLFNSEGRVTGFEALARWQHPLRGLIPPDCFIPLAEQSHLMQALTRSVLRRAVTQCASWRAAGHEVYVAVNIAPSLLHDDSLCALVADELNWSGLDPAHLTLEMTEGRLADGANPMVSSTLTLLRDQGVRLSIDDFGTGYSSLAYLKTLPITELKIDRSFITNIDIDPRDVAIVRALVQLAKTLHLDVVAEGVESEDAARTLRSLGCDTLQGFALGRPMFPEDATALLARQPAPEPTFTRADRDASTVAVRSLHILTVDHDPAIRDMLRHTLEGENHHVLEVSSGEQALIDVDANRPDLIVLDHYLGEGLTGVETAVLLRSVGFDGPIILLSGALDAGLTAYRFPLDVWPVGKEDHDTLIQLVSGCATLIARTHSGDATSTERR